MIGPVSWEIEIIDQQVIASSGEDHGPSGVPIIPRLGGRIQNKEKTSLMRNFDEIERILRGGANEIGEQWEDEGEVVTGVRSSSSEWNRWSSLHQARGGSV